MSTIMVKAPFSPEILATRRQPTRTPTNIWLIVLAAWCLSGLLSALGFSFGLSYMRPAKRADAQRNWREAVAWMDGRWYEQIATDGYHYDPNARSNVAFFPVYPLSASALMKVFGLRAETSLLIVSNGSFLGALAMLALYVRDRYPDAPRYLADYAVVTAALFPTGCFFRLAYSESTFLLLALVAMYAMLRRWQLWEIAFVVGLATATRPVGIALLAPFAIHIVRRTRAEWKTESLEGGDAAFAIESSKTADQHRRVGARSQSVRGRYNRSVARLAIYMPLATSGLAVFLAYQAFVFGEPLATAKVQTNWGVRRVVSWQEKAVALITLEPVWSVYDARSPAYWRNRDPHGVRLFSLQFATPIIFASAIVLVTAGATVRERGSAQCARAGSPAGPSYQWLSLEETSLAALLLLIPYVTRAYEMGLGSMGRFVAVAFPVYLVLAKLLTRIPAVARCCLLAFPGLLFAAYAALYAAGYAIF